MCNFLIINIIAQVLLIFLALDHSMQTLSRDYFVLHSRCTIQRFEKLLLLEIYKQIP